MRHKQPHAPSAWWKAVKYEIREGILRPADHARLESWDPWKSFHQIQGQRRTTMTRFMEKTQVRVKTNGLNGSRNLVQ